MHIRKLETKNAPDGGDGFDEIKAAIEQHASATTETVDGLKSTIAKLESNLVELEQRQAESGLGGLSFSTVPNIAASLVKNEHVAAVASKKSRDTSTEVKTSALFGLERKNTVTDNSGDFHNVVGTGIFGGLERRRFILDFLRIVPVPAGHAAYTKETSFTNAAATQAAGSPLVYTEGASKAESSVVYELVDMRLSTTAHFIKASNQALADVAMLGNILDGRLRYGLRVRCDAKIVSSLTTSGNYTAFTPTSGDDGINSINRAIAQLETADAMATLVLLNPATYRSIQRLRATGGNEQPIMGAPSGVNREAVWNVPILPSNAMTAGKLLVLDTDNMGEYYQRSEAQVDIGYVNDDFVKNLVTIRAEERGDLAVVRSAAVVYGDLTL